MGALALALAPVLGLAGSVSAAAADDLTVTVDIPGTDELRVTDAQLRWGLNAEAGSGAFFGGCNFLSAGAAGNSGGSRLWTDADTRGSDALFRTRDGEVSIVKPDGDGGWQTFDWAGRCQDATGRTVTSTGGDLGTGVTAVIDGGAGVVDLEAGTADIQSRGSVTVSFYGGLTYWWFTDPRLTVSADGTGTLTATIGGYGTSMEDMTRWERLSPIRDVEIATLTGVALGEDGLSIVPDYEGVRVRVPASLQDQVRTGADWGSFPQEFVDAQVRTGQAAYWYSSGGLRDFAKPASTLWISYDAATPTTTTPPAPSTPSSPTTTPPTAAPGTAQPGGPGGGTGGTTPGRSVIPPTLAGTTPTLAQPASISAPTMPTWLTPGLIPAATGGGGRGADDLFTLGFASVLGLTSVAFVGFRSGWLVLPFTKAGP